jgi:hypothetical protein
MQQCNLAVRFRNVYMSDLAMRFSNVFSTFYMSDLAMRLSNAFASFAHAM